MGRISSYGQVVGIRKCLANRHYSNYSPFQKPYKREPVVPTDVKYKLLSAENSHPDKTFDEDIFDAVVASPNVIREEVHRQAG